MLYTSSKYRTALARCALEGLIGLALMRAAAGKRVFGACSVYAHLHKEHRVNRD